MDCYNFSRDPEKGKFSGGKKCSPKDVKKKLSCINKRISDLHHQKKLVYRNSMKVKKMVHNQVNQIVRCFRARERNICSDVDEINFLQDSNINDELSRLQSAFAHCQALLNHMDDFKEKSDVLRNIDSILSEINFDEKTDVKPIEFTSDFETMKAAANAYGYLEGDFVKKEDFVFVEERKDIFSDKCKLLSNKKVLDDKESSLSVSPVLCKQKNSYKTTDCDDFQIIDLLDNMNCHDEDDIIMDEDDKQNCTQYIDDKLDKQLPRRNENAFRIKEYNSLKFPEACERNVDFNPEEEWKQILEMNKKIESWHELTSKETVTDLKRKEKSFDKNCNPHKFVLLKEADNWLHISKNEGKLGKKEVCEKPGNGMNSLSPAEIIQKSFKSYLVKDNIQNWLSAF